MYTTSLSGLDAQIQITEPGITLLVIIIMMPLLVPLILQEVGQQDVDFLFHSLLGKVYTI